MSVHEIIYEAVAHINTAIETLDKLTHPDGNEINPLVDRLEELRDEIEREGDEARFIHLLRKEPKDGYGLVDDGTLDTVLSCPQCKGWLRFDGREAAINFLETDRACWLCSHE